MNNYKELADLDIPKKRQIYDIIGGHPWTIGQFAKLSSAQDVDSLMLDLKLKPLKKELIEFTLLDKSFLKLDADAKKLLLYASIYEEASSCRSIIMDYRRRKRRKSLYCRATAKTNPVGLDLKRAGI